MLGQDGIRCSPAAAWKEIPAGLFIVSAATEIWKHEENLYGLFFPTVKHFLYL